jgi:hypothetical protein
LALKAVKVVTLEEPRKDLLHIRSSSSLLAADGVTNVKLGGHAYLGYPRNQGDECNHMYPTWAGSRTH